MRKKLTQEEVVAKFEAIEKIKKRGYTFENVVYESSKQKVSVTCNVEGHGDFLITPNDFKKGVKCGKCENSKKNKNKILSEEEVLAKFEKIEKIKQRGYTFENVVYTGSHKKVSITCNIKGHGDFLISPSDFKKGIGCSSCYENRRGLTQEEVFAQFEAIEKIKQRGYTFENVIYIDTVKKVSITCSIKEHGDFLISPKSFKEGSGCPKCQRKKSANQQETVISQLKEIEKIKKRGYTFENVVYLNARTEVSITCPVEGHGDFLRTVNSFKAGSMCPKCSTLTQEKVLSRFQEIEIKKKRGYTFEDVVFLNTRTKVSITCPVEGHGKFLINPNNFIKGFGCTKCKKGGGFDRKKPEILYYNRYNKDDIELYKLGITNHTVEKRYPFDFKFMTVLKTIEFENGQEAYDFEQSILNNPDYAEAKWKGPPLLKNGGNTELMKYDILGWDV